MSKIYAIIGTSSMTVVADSVKYTPATNEVLMQSERPAEGDYVANENGEWVVDKTKQLEELDSRYNKDKDELKRAYLDAVIYGDDALAESIKAEIDALDEQYDADYDEIEGGE